MKTFGEQSWSETPVAENKSGGKDSFLRLQKGTSNEIRILTNPYLYKQHKFMPPEGSSTKAKWGYRINCSDPANRIDCPLCEIKDEAKSKWLVGVIDRAEGRYKILDIGYSIFKDIQSLSQHKSWGPPNDPENGYSVDVIVSNKVSPDMYRIVAQPKSPLSKADLMIREEHPAEELAKRAAPPPRARVQEQFDAMMEEINGSKADDSASETSKSDENDDDFFRSYQTKK